MALIEARALQIGYPGASSLLVAPLNLTIEAGDAWGIVGPNGAGKTTLLRTLLGLMPARGGAVTRSADLRVGYVPQRAAMDVIFPATVGDVVMMGRLSGRPGWHRVRPADHEAVKDCLSRVGLGALVARRFQELSGGQRQRVLIARALALAPALLVLDEPTDGLDLTAEADMLALVDALRRETGAAVIMVTHALRHAGRGGRLLVIRGDGEVDMGPAAELLQADRLTRLYGRTVVVEEVGGERVVVVLPETGVSE